ncbi:glycosyltransferase [bacterium]|nr:glycosyltransferase [bacterium]MBU1995144.1 glycosyltransferase [bacterium]
MKNKTIVFKLKHLYENDPVDRIRGRNIIAALQKRGWHVELYNNQKKIDVILYLGDDLYDKVIYRHINSSFIIQDLQDDPFKKSVASAYMRAKSKKSLYDKILENVKTKGIQYTLYLLILKYFWRLMYVQYLKKADLIITSSQSLKKSVQKVNPRVVCIPDSIENNSLKKVNYHSAKVKICWIGTVNNIGYLLLVNEVLHTLQKKYGVEVVIITSKEMYNDDSLVHTLSQFLFHYSFVEWSLEEVDKNISECDIAIAPLPQGVAKSTNKILSSMRLGVPTVCSGSEDYKLLSQESVHSCIFVEDNGYEAWYENLQALIVSQEKREEMGQNGYKLSQKYGIDSIILKYEKVLQSL